MREGVMRMARRLFGDPAHEVGAHRFLVRNWAAVSDAGLASRILGTEYFTAEMAPVALPLEEMKSILVLVPHQDDEAVGAGGTLLLAAKAGARIHILFTTDGAQYQPPDSVRIRPVCGEMDHTRTGETSPSHSAGTSATGW